MTAPRAPAPARGAVGIISPGDMGSAIGKVLHDGGLDVVTCLAGRSPLTRTRAAESGMRDVPSLDDLVRECSIVLSVLVPAEAVPLAERLAGAVRRTGHRPVFAECNAIAPQTVTRIAAMMTDAGVATIDAGIIGAPPKTGRSTTGSSSTRIYCSGPDTGALEALAEYGLDVRNVGSRVGQASGLKMVYAASTKGTTALWTELLVAARALGMEDALRAELALGRSDVAGALMAQVPSMPRRARRWAGEMEEIAATFDALGLTPRMLLGAADMFRFVGGTPLAGQTSREPDPPLDGVLGALAKALPNRDNGRSPSAAPRAS